MQLTHGTNDQLMALAAHRYCLGRSTYMVQVCIEWLMKTWPQFTNESKYLIIRDILDALDNNCAGMYCDVRNWIDVTRWMLSQMNEEQKISVLHYIKNKNITNIENWLAKTLNNYAKQYTEF